MNQKRIVSFLFGLAVLFVSFSSVAECKFKNQQQQDCIRNEQAQQRAQQKQQPQPQQRAWQEQQQPQQQAARQAEALRQQQISSQQREAQQRAILKRSTANIGNASGHPNTPVSPRPVTTYSLPEQHSLSTQQAQIAVNRQSVINIQPKQSRPATRQNQAQAPVVTARKTPTKQTNQQPVAVAHQGRQQIRSSTNQAVPASPKIVWRKPSLPQQLATITKTTSSTREAANLAATPTTSSVVKTVQPAKSTYTVPCDQTPTQGMAPFAPDTCRDPFSGGQVSRKYLEENPQYAEKVRSKLASDALQRQIEMRRPLTFVPTPSTFVAAAPVITPAPSKDTPAPSVITLAPSGFVPTPSTFVTAAPVITPAPSRDTPAPSVVTPAVGNDREAQARSAVNTGNAQPVSTNTAKQSPQKIEFVYDCNHFPGQGALGRSYTDNERKFVADCGAQFARTTAEINASNHRIDTEIGIAKGVKNGADIAGTGIAVVTGVAEGAVLVRGAYGVGKTILENRAVTTVESAAVRGVDTAGEGGSVIYGSPSGLVQSRVDELSSMIPENSQGRITMGVAVVEDTNGVRSVLISTSEPRGYLRPSVILKPDEKIVVGTGHAEADIVSFANANGLKIIDIGATRPVCPSCQNVIESTGANISTPLKSP